MLRVAPALLLLTFTVSGLPQQTSPSSRPPMPRDYRGPSVHIDGIWVAPVSGAPFTATVQIVSHTKLPDGSEHIVKTEDHIARSSSGRIRNERRLLVPQNFIGEPRLLSAHIYDPASGANIFIDPATRIARETILSRPPRTPVRALPPAAQRMPPGVVETPLGEQTFEDVQLVGTRKTRVVPADRSGTGQPITITDEYWYSPDLSIYFIIRHNDPRTGEQLVAVTQVERAEPAAELLTVPDDYKLVDETPPPPVAPVPNP